MKIAIGSDHGGFKIKEALKEVLLRGGVAVDDVGTHSLDSVDYPDFAQEVARQVSSRTADQGILICTTGIGMSIAANKFTGVRAALCVSPDMAQKARTHNNANVLVLAGSLLSPRDAEAILSAWREAPFSDQERHVRRVNKIAAMEVIGADAIAQSDPEIFQAICHEIERQNENINLIASENYTSRAIREAQGSVMTNKYAEGYPGKRYYNGCQFVDEAERLAIERAQTLFGAEHANVQPHCGSSANMAVYFSALKPGDTILAMSLAHGGHLTHGHPVNFSGRLFNIVGYGVEPGTESIDPAVVAAAAEKHKPKMIVVGASAYPRILDFSVFRKIADSVGALLMVDMAHIAGLVAGGCHPNPVPHADFVTSTTHKTLRGPRSGMILCKARHAADLDKQVFPGLQGGPLMHTIAAKAICFHEAATPAFAEYARQIVRNAKALAGALSAAGCRLVSGGTDNHLMLVDLTAQGITGRDAAEALDRVGVIVNKNAIPFDSKSPAVTSGIRIGTPAVTSRGMKEAEMESIASIITDILKSPGDPAIARSAQRRVHDLAAAFPVRI
jgi:glycine hydroxymethyltransferase